MIYFIYLTWFVNQIMIPVIFMNFIVAFIMGKYFEVKERKVILL